MTPKEVLARAAELIESAQSGEDVRRFAVVIHGILLDALGKIEDFLSEDGETKPEIAVTPVKVGRPKGSKNKQLELPPAPKTMLGETNAEGMVAPCEICACSWAKPCPETCGWSEDYIKAGRYVCTVPACRKKAYDSDIAFLMRTGNTGGYCGPVSAEQLMAEKRSTELKN